MSLNEPHLEDADNRLLDIMSRSYFAVRAMVVVLLLGAISAASISMMGDQLVDLAMETFQQDNETWGNDDLDPAFFALDGRPFFIEPAAGPLDQADIPPCRDLPTEEPSCSQ